MRAPDEAPASEEIHLQHLPPDWWQHPGPHELDLGCARGKFLVAVAEQFPETRFLGIERQSDRVLRARRKIARLGLRNAWAIQGEILTCLREQVPAASVQRVHLLFPDPWPKRRHAARRIFQPEFLRAIERLLQTGGILRFVTDQLEYHRSVAAWWTQEPGWTLQAGEVEPNPWPPTEFQSRFLAAGLPVYTLLGTWQPSTA